MQSEPPRVRRTSSGFSWSRDVGGLDRVKRGEVPGELIVDTGRRWFVLRTVRWPDDLLDLKWRPQLVVVDVLLPFVVLNRLRASPRREVLPW
jgi:hypothetical protein